MQFVKQTERQTITDSSRQPRHKLKLCNIRTEPVFRSAKANYA